MTSHFKETPRNNHPLFDTLCLLGTNILTFLDEYKAVAAGFYLPIKFNFDAFRVRAIRHYEIVKKKKNPERLGIFEEIVIIYNKQ